MSFAGDGEQSRGFCNGVSSVGSPSQQSGLHFSGEQSRGFCNGVSSVGSPSQQSGLHFSDSSDESRSSISDSSSDSEDMSELKTKYDKLLQAHIEILDENSTLHAKVSELTISNNELKMENSKLHADYLSKKTRCLKKLRQAKTKIDKAKKAAAASASKPLLDEDDINEIANMVKIKLHSYANAVSEAIFTKINGHPPAKDPKDEMITNITYKIMKLFDDQRYETMQEIEKSGDALRKSNTKE